ncbi:SDR family NAD(P)-dependent oxidoreductase [Burkholderia cepacia]|uniref:SDR family NAD(P)-dependent oxidoreductase n=1 Tax=Burkholderia cepacia TaxID=292 RepID=UPI001CF3E4F6|nr:SDR family oxidoreductase [Burkholderia cepacia]MCA8350744.1 SDR family oxidoreductase [Burkholderia cepacia]
MNGQSPGLRGKNAVVFDASYDLGPHYVRGLLERGARVWALGADPGRLGVLEGLERLVSVPLVDSRPESLATAAAAAASSAGKVDILIHNDKRSAHPNLATEDYENSDWHETFDRNIHSAFYLTKALLSVMKTGAGGSMLFVSTSSTKVTLLGPHLRVAAAYEAANAALNRFARRLAAELGPFGINVNALCVGNVEKEAIASLARQLADQAGVSPQAIISEILARQKMDGFIPIDHVVAQLCHLVSPVSRYLTGQEVMLSGGMDL